MNMRISPSLPPLPQLPPQAEPQTEVPAQAHPHTEPLPHPEDHHHGHHARARPASQKRRTGRQRAADEIGFGDVLSIGEHGDTEAEEEDNDDIRRSEQRRSDRTIDAFGEKQARNVYDAVSGTAPVRGTKAISRAKRMVLTSDMKIARTAIWSTAIKIMEQKLSEHVMQDLGEQMRIEYGDKVIIGRFLPGIEVR